MGTVSAKVPSPRGPGTPKGGQRGRRFSLARRTGIVGAEGHHDGAFLAPLARAEEADLQGFSIPGTIMAHLGAPLGAPKGTDLQDFLFRDGENSFGHHHPPFCLPGLRGGLTTGKGVTEPVTPSCSVASHRDSGEQTGEPIKSPANGHVAVALKTTASRGPAARCAFCPLSPRSYPRSAAWHCPERSAEDCARRSTVGAGSRWRPPRSLPRLHPHGRAQATSRGHLASRWLLRTRSIGKVGGRPHLLRRHRRARSSAQRPARGRAEYPRRIGRS